MPISKVSPCGLICDICWGFQREKNRCFGCLEGGSNSSHQEKCSILNCPEKNGDPAKPCMICSQYPCKRLKNLEKRYTTNYGESLMENFRQIEDQGLEQFLLNAETAWRCLECGNLLSAHRPQCLHCKSTNSHYKKKKE